MNFRCFIIHLRRASNRKVQVAEIMRRCPIEAEVLDAVDGHSLQSLDFQAYRRRLHEPHYPFRLRNGEIAAFLSHRAAWTRIVADRLDAALVLEDDVEIGPDFAAALDLARRTLRPDDIIRFPVGLRERPGRIVARDGAFTVFRPKRVRLGMQGMLIGHDAAATLLGKTRSFDRPVDTALQMHWLTGISICAVLPSGLTEGSRQLGGSLIGERKSLAERMHHEVMRPLYRWKIARLARKSMDR